MFIGPFWTHFVAVAVATADRYKTTTDFVSFLSFILIAGMMNGLGSEAEASTHYQDQPESDADEEVRSLDLPGKPQPQTSAHLFLSILCLNLTYTFFCLRTFQLK